MSGGFGIIAGKITNGLVKELKLKTSINISRMWETTTDLSVEITTIPSKIIDNMDAIVLIDSGFSKTRFDKKSGKHSDSDSVVQEFLELQDAMTSQNFNHVKLYFITRDVNTYNKLKGNINGLDGIFYKYAEMFLIESSLTVAYMKSVYQGSYDKMGIYSKHRDDMTKVERLEYEQKALVEDAQQVSKDSLEFGNTNPISEINQNEVVGSKKHNELLKERELKERRLERENERLRKQKGKLKGKNVTIVEPETVSTPNVGGKAIDIILPSVTKQEITPVQSQEAIPDINFSGVEHSPLKSKVSVSTDLKSGVPTNSELKELYRQLNQTDSDTIEKKLVSDKGIISFIGERGSGVSGLVAQTAEVYAMLDKSVLIIDLDTLTNQQTVYFPTYVARASDFKGVANSIGRITQEINLKTIPVPVTSKISILSDAKANSTIQEGFHSTITNVLEQVLESAIDEFDIVLLDLPLEYLPYYKKYFDMIDKNVFVTENKFYSVEDFFSIKLEKALGTLDVFSSDIIAKSCLVLNKYRADFRHLDGTQMNRFKVQSMLLSVGAPYDRIQVLGEIPEYKEWEEQYYTKARYIWTDDLALSLYRRVVSRLL